jgi:ferritin-like metal-binding protein YciE
MTSTPGAKPLFNLRDLLGEQLRDLYDAERQYAAQLPQMVGKATSSYLRDKLQEVSERVPQHAELLAQACELLEVPPEGVTCEAMRGLIREAKDTASEWGDSATLDASLISNAQRIAHYEIAGFGTARAFARCLKLVDIADLLQEMLIRSIRDDKDFSYIANGGWFSPGINHEAAEPAKQPVPTDQTETEGASGVETSA